MRFSLFRHAAALAASGLMSWLAVCPMSSHAGSTPEPGREPEIEAMACTPQRLRALADVWHQVRWRGLTATPPEIDWERRMAESLDDLCVADPVLAEDALRVLLAPFPEVAAQPGTGDVWLRRLPLDVMEARAQGQLNPFVTEPFSPRFDEVPPLAWRWMAAIKLWSSLKAVSRPLSFPAMRWDVAFDEAIDAMPAATSKDRYVDVLRRMLTALDDGHARLMGRWMRARIGTGELPVRLRRAGPGIVVAEVVGTGDDAPPAARVGDVVLTIDDVPVVEAMASQRPFVSALTWASRELLTLDLLTRRPVGQSATLRVRREGREIDLTLLATREPSLEVSRPAARRLSKTVGYLDLSAIEDLSTVDPLLRGAKTLIVDLRRYPRGAAWDLAARLQKQPVARSPLNWEPRAGLAEGAEIPRTILRRAAVHWPARMIALIGEETQSQGNYSVLLLQSVTTVCTVGAKTFGTYGNIAAVSLPGGLVASFTANDVMTADGRLAPAEGLTPDIDVVIQAEDFAAGRDPVLSAAMYVAEAGRRCAARREPLLNTTPRGDLVSR
ncbi:S41 family peptidase [Roseateles chitinivorans]|uniref:S41 family peptidase n=1 Tax=Roseateles chitinivorans TaxID=2917965 RepID=UPI003D6789BF